MDLRGNIGILVLLPDAAVLGAIEQIGGLVDSLGLVPIAARPVQLDTVAATRFYRGKATAKTAVRGRKYGAILTRDLFRLDSSIAVAVCGDGDAARTLHDAKGPSAFLQRRSNSLRAVARSSDRGQSLIHTPDDIADTRQSAGLFWSATEIGQLNDAGADIAADHRIDWATIASIRSYRIPTLETSRYEPVAVVLNRLVARAICAFRVLPRSSDAIAGLNQASRLLRNWLETTAFDDPQQERSRFIALTGGLAESVVDGQLVGEVWQYLLDFGKYDLDIAEHIIDSLGHYDMAMSEFEKHSLRTLLAFFDD